MVGGLSIAEELWLDLCNMALHNIALGAVIEIYYFTWLTNQFSPSKFTINWVCYESELQRSPCWWHCIDYCILILHVFSQSFLLFLIYISFLAAVFFCLFCIVGSGYSPLEDDEDVYARNRYKGECFAYVLRISWLLKESFVLFLFMDYKILVIQFHGFSHGFLDQDLISVFFNNGN